ncbi:MAG: rod shape-determining protein RodA [Bacillota bacterium]|nr:rod shape-determining protein RodA [Bacillota bacterium]
MLDRRLVKSFDFPLLGVTLALLLLGLLVVYSATQARDLELYGDRFYHLLRQALAAGIGLLALAAVVNVDYGLFERLARPLYLCNLALLVLVLVVGKTVSHSQSWLHLGALGSFQPSELAKILVILTLAKQLQEGEDRPNFTQFLLALVHVGIPMILILLQPDLGTAMVFVGILFGMLFVYGIPNRYLLGAILLAVVLSPFLYFFVLADYQRARLMVLINPYSDPVKSGYNVIQSMIAIGSGRLFGKGLFSGTQTQLNFVPEHHTDFIFSVVGEEFGFLGGLFLLGAYFFILWRGLQIIELARDEYGQLVAAGVVSMLLFHVLINVGMTLGIMPVTGIPLPLISYGGSSLIANLVGIGLLLNIYLRRQKIIF